MKTQIKKLTIISQIKTKSYEVGQSVGGLIIDEIKDQSIEEDAGIAIIYRGFTKDYNIVFETVNAPILCEYYSN